MSILNFLDFRCTEVFKSSQALHFNLDSKIEEGRWARIGSLTIFCLESGDFHFIVIIQSTIFEDLGPGALFKGVNELFASIKKVPDAEFSFEIVSENDGIEYRSDAPRRRGE